MALPDGYGPPTAEEVLAFLESERRDLLAQMRREIHTRGTSGSGYMKRQERRIQMLRDHIETRKRTCPEH